ncbi:MAG TPA: VWA domain-containing protein [Pyrinomonadaceae bacterium]|nr:VWA domain-containing protein [Pyrinomonadaceae bacterium]
MRFFTLIFTATLFASIASAQSGRQKPSPTPTPRQIVGPSVVYMPTETVNPVGKPTPTPTPKPNSGDDVIKVDSVLIPIPVSVLDQNGKAVSTLQLKDFELKIDGKVVEIGELARSDTPIRLAMLFDNSSSVLIAREFEKDAAVRFFRRVVRPDKDKAALFSVADYTRLEQSLTSDVAQLTQAIEMFQEPKGATALLDGIIEVAEYLRAANGRRVVVIVSDGEDTYSDLKTTLEGVVKSLQINDCQVYVVKTKDFENFKRTGVRGGNANIRALTAERRMIELAEQTGGAVYSPIDEDEMKQAFDRISAELSQQYILSYYPEDEALKPGEFRTISLTVKAKPNMTIRTRKGYYVGRK